MKKIRVIKQYEPKIVKFNSKKKEYIMIRENEKNINKIIDIGPAGYFRNSFHSSLYTNMRWNGKGEGLCC